MLQQRKAEIKNEITAKQQEIQGIKQKEQEAARIVKEYEVKMEENERALNELEMRDRQMQQEVAQSIQKLKGIEQQKDETLKVLKDTEQKQVQNQTQLKDLNDKIKVSFEF